jgi:hypothetical protein
MDVKVFNVDENVTNCSLYGWKSSQCGWKEGISFSLGVVMCANHREGAPFIRNNLYTHTQLNYSRGLLLEFLDSKVTKNLIILVQKLFLARTRVQEITLILEILQIMSSLTINVKFMIDS